MTIMIVASEIRRGYEIPRRFVFDLDDGKNFCYRSRVSHNAFFHSLKQRNWRDVVKQLNGNITFIKGNHCDPKVMRRLVDEGYIHAFYDYKEIKIGDQPVVLFHFPIQSWHKQGYGSLHLHGHCHGNLKSPQGKMLDVGLDSSYNLYGTHRFFSEFDVLNYMVRQELVITDHHKER